MRHGIRIPGTRFHTGDSVVVPGGRRGLITGYAVTKTGTEIRIRYTDAARTHFRARSLKLIPKKAKS